jgi:uncharacterized protein (DUF433 family)
MEHTLAATRDLDLIRRTPAYTFGEAAHYLRLPKSTLRAWCLGQQQFRSIIRLDGKPSEGLSFLNLVEAHVLAAIRRGYGVPMYKVRPALAYVRKELGIERPLADAQFETNGLELFTERLGQLVNVSSHGQLAIPQILGAYLKRVERDARGIPIKLFPFTRKSAPGDTSTPVEIDPTVAFGRPVLRSRGVATAVLADRFKAGDTLAELAADYEVANEEVEEAIRVELYNRVAA